MARNVSRNHSPASRGENTRAINPRRPVCRHQCVFKGFDSGVIGGRTDTRVESLFQTGLEVVREYLLRLLDDIVDLLVEIHFKPHTKNIV